MTNFFAHPHIIPLWMHATNTSLRELVTERNEATLKLHALLAAHAAERSEDTRVIEVRGHTAAIVPYAREWGEG